MEPMGISKLSKASLASSSAATRWISMGPRSISGFGVEGLGFRVWSLGFRGLGFRVWGVWGLGV